MANFEIIDPNDYDTISSQRIENEENSVRSINLILSELDVSAADKRGIPENLNIGTSKDPVKKDELNRLLKLIRKHINLFATNPDNPGQVTKEVAEHCIDVQGAQPISEGPRRTSPHNRQVTRDAIKNMLQSGIIEPSRSPWAAPIVLVPKKSGEIRFAIDYRKLNEVTKKEIYPIPRIDDTLDALGEAKYFSTFDLAAGYWQIPMKKEDREKTAFISYEGQYQYKVMPFGLCNAPATFQRMMDVVLAGLKWQSCLVYLDDVIVFSSTFDKHLVDLDNVLTRLGEANLKLKPKKCHICCSEVDFLGHVISNMGVQADPKKLDSIRNWPIPRTVKQVQSFLGLTGYYRRLIKDYALIEHPLRCLTKNNVDFIIGSKEMDAFNKLKQALLSNPI